MGYEVYFTDLAKSDLYDIAEYIAQDNLATALSFVDRLQERINKTLSTFPKGGTAYKNSFVMSFQNYTVVYTVDDERKFVFIQLVTEGHGRWERLVNSRV